MHIAIAGQPFDRFKLPVEGGSIKLWTYEVARRLASQGHSVTVYARRAPGQIRSERFGGVEYRRIAAVSEPALLERLPMRWSIGRPLHSRAFGYFSFFSRVAMDLRRTRPDALLIHNFSQAIPIVRTLNSNLRIGLLMNCQWLEQLDRDMIRPRLEAADLLAGCSDFISDGIRRAFPHLADKVRTIYNGASVEKFSAEPSGRNGERLLFVGRLSPEKGMHVLLEAFERVLQRQPEASMDLVGPGAVMTEALLADPAADPLMAGLIPLCRPDYPDRLRGQLSPIASTRVRFLGNVPHSKLPELYRQADIFVFPSIWHEPFGMPVVEAMASGLPVIATRGGGIPELIDDGKTGILVERGQVEPLADAISRLLSSAPLRHSMGQEGMRRAARFSWEHTAEQTIAAFHPAGRQTVADAVTALR
jgi:glycosyltransferase involved in cell wall biosynthesis